MEQNFVTRNQAIHLDALGMDEPCFGGYLKDESNHFANMIHYPELAGTFRKENKGWCKNFKGFIQYRHKLETI